MECNAAHIRAHARGRLASPPIGHASPRIAPKFRNLMHAAFFLSTFTKIPSFRKKSAECYRVENSTRWYSARDISSSRKRRTCYRAKETKMGASSWKLPKKHKKIQKYAPSGGYFLRHFSPHNIRPKSGQNSTRKCRNLKRHFFKKRFTR